ncbi:MAG: hypothetical protein R3286_07190, partial [Gammaproteobacteria bacterium]|nr:hypothetical protein [Gammaproteobacteria bacterium]
MAADAERPGTPELCARLRTAVLDLAPEESAPEESAPGESVPGESAPVAERVPGADTWERAASEAARLVEALEAGDDPLRVLLAADMALAIDDAARADGRNRGRLVSLLDQSVSVLADKPPVADAAGVLPSRTPMALANELRAIRGAPLLSGNRVFALVVDARAPDGDADARHASNPRLAASCRRLRSYFQQGLVAWLRDAEHAGAAAGRMGEVFARLHSLGHGGPQETLWRAAASFARLIEDPRWRVSAAVKRLLGQLDAQMKRLCESEGATPEPPPALVRDLLFYVGEVRDVEATIGLFASRSALLAAFAAPGRQDADQPTAVLSLLNELLAISADVMEALGPDESWLAKRSWLIERMLEVADGLGLLGAHHLRRRALAEIRLLRGTSGSGDPPAGGWGPVAERLHVLGADLLSAAGMEPAEAVADDTAGMPAT